MEVILVSLLALLLVFSILHVCGGDPGDTGDTYDAKKYSPRVWRWSLRMKQAQSGVEVFSTCVEVILLIFSE